MLVGADFFWKLVNPYKLPVECSGIWLTSDRFGRYFIAGKIPGSSKARQQQSVNHISIHHINTEHPNLREHIRTECQILDNSEFVHELNAFDIVREMNSYDALGFSVTSRNEDDSEALRTI